ncbi:Vitamin D 25-hydroxylase [Talaromyces islandicus]|uniref:Vitamin D 25-hydroxylase n=1 Tax=Talaromyces islandicus TaxID=28573 RepID=A0A0U1MBQ0_TALIS|nr:Vitamin D 25-hydroxylase [Talaromyces islandicus]
MTTGVTVAVAGILVGLAYVLLTVGSRDARLPPGPPTLPFIGNLHQIPRRRSHLKYTEFAKTYGGLYTVKAGHRTMAIINERRVVRELLEEKGSIASNRPPSYIVQEIISKRDHLLTLEYGPMWRLYRKLIHQCFMESVCDKHHVHLQHAEAVQMLRDFIAAPGDYMLHPRRYSNSVITSIVYGIRITSPHAIYMERLYEMLDEFTALLELGATPPVDLYPFLKWIPERLLGNWMTRSTHVKDIMESLHQPMFQHVINRRQKFGHKDSFMDRLLADNDKLGFSPHQLSFLGGGLVEGGSETPAALIISFIQAMTKWTEVQKKAQQEIDSLIGEDRTPTWEDYGRLSYVAALVKECVRWRPVAPLGMPHFLDQDVWVDGKFLPKGTILVLNIWGLNHDEKFYPNSQEFDPTRYEHKMLPASEYVGVADHDNRDHYSYGAGRRLCTGIHIAERDLFIAMSMLLWAFNFEQQTDPVSGQPLVPDTDPDTGYIEGLVTCPKQFPCKVTVRSAERKETIMREFAQAEAGILSKYDECVDMGAHI